MNAAGAQGRHRGERRGGHSRRPGRACEPDDVIVALDGKPITSAGRSPAPSALLRPGTEVTLTRLPQGPEAGPQGHARHAAGPRGRLPRGRGPQAQEEPHQRIGLGLCDVDPAARRAGCPRGRSHPGGAGLRGGARGTGAGHGRRRGRRASRCAAPRISPVLREARPGSVVLLRIQLGGPGRCARSRSPSSRPGPRRPRAAARAGAAAGRRPRAPSSRSDPPRAGCAR